MRTLLPQAPQAFWTVEHVQSNAARQQPIHGRTSGICVGWADRHEPVDG